MIKVDLVFTITIHSALLGAGCPAKSFLEFKRSKTNLTADFIRCVWISRFRNYLQGFAYYSGSRGGSVTTETLFNDGVFSVFAVSTISTTRELAVFCGLVAKRDQEVSSVHSYGKDQGLHLLRSLYFSLTAHIFWKDSEMNITQSVTRMSLLRCHTVLIQTADLLAALDFN